MTGERLAWYRVASHLRLPVGELRARITYTEFQNWLVFLKREEQWRLKHEHYLAQIAAEVCKTRVKSPRSIKVKDFYVTFKPIDTDKTEASKSAWLGAVSLKTKIKAKGK